MRTRRVRGALPAPARFCVESSPSKRTLPHSTSLADFSRLQKLAAFATSVEATSLVVIVMLLLCSFVCATVFGFSSLPGMISVPTHK